MCLPLFYFFFFVRFELCFVLSCVFTVLVAVLLGGLRWVLEVGTSFDIVVVENLRVPRYFCQLSVFFSHLSARIGGEVLTS